MSLTSPEVDKHATPRALNQPKSNLARPPQQPLTSITGSQPAEVTDSSKNASPSRSRRHDKRREVCVHESKESTGTFLSLLYFHPVRGQVVMEGMEADTVLPPVSTLSPSVRVKEVVRVSPGPRSTNNTSETPASSSAQSQPVVLPPQKDVGQSEVSLPLSKWASCLVDRALTSCLSRPSSGSRSPLHQALSRRQKQGSSFTP